MGGIDISRNAIKRQFLPGDCRFLHAGSIHKSGQAYGFIGRDVMASETEVALKIEIMLQINERLYLTGLIGQTLYEQARIKIQKNERG